MKLMQQHPELATKGVSIDVGNAWLAALAKDLLSVVPGWMMRFIGGKDRIEDMIRNRLPEVLRDIELPLDALSQPRASAG